MLHAILSYQQTEQKNYNKLKTGRGKTKTHLKQIRRGWPQIWLPENQLLVRNSMNAVYTDGKKRGWSEFERPTNFCKHFKRKSLASNDKWSGMGGCDFVVPM